VYPEDAYGLARSRLACRLQVREQLVEVDITHAATTYRLLEGHSLEIERFGEQLRRTRGVPLSLPAPASPAAGEPQDLPRAA
jgi:alpha,alpha-trehalose phosphorylase